MSEQGNDMMLAAMGVTDVELAREAHAGALLSSVEEKRCREAPVADDEPGEDRPEPEPAGLDPDTGFDPLPPDGA